MRGVELTAGHRSDQMGIRGHSAGPVFPFVVYAQGTPDELYHWVLQPNGLRIGPFEKYEQAEGLAGRLKATGQIAKDDAATVAAGLNPPTHNYFTDIDGLHQEWRWRCKIGEQGDQPAEYTDNHGKSWHMSAHPVKALRNPLPGQTFRSLGTDPQWPNIQ